MRRIISIHEAGHAVVAVMYTVPFQLVTVIPDLENYMLGYIEFTEPLHQSPVTPAQKAENLARCKVLLAGPAAKEKMQIHYDPDRGRNDFKTTKQILGAFYKTSTEAEFMLRLLKDEVRRLFTNRHGGDTFLWDTTIKIGMELRKKGTLTFLEVKELFHSP